MGSYDLDNDKIFNNEELEKIQKILVDYIEPRNYLMELSFYDDDNLAKNIEYKIKNYRIEYIDNKILFYFQNTFSLDLIENRTLKLVFKDKENFFDFKILPSQKLALNDSLYLLSNVNNYVAFYKVSNANTFNVKRLSDITPKINPYNDIEEDKSYYKCLKETLSKYTDKIKNSLQSIEKENSLSKMLLLLGFSFLYGFFHALGPGHGKTLVTSYFVANGGNWYKALLFSFRIGIIHVLSAFVLVMTSMYIIKTFISKVLSDVSVYTSYISAFIIISIAVYMFLKKITKKTNEHSCSCNSCKSTKEDWAISISAGIIPCAGTVVIFILTFTLGNYMIGILSALAMAVGMGSVIFVSSMLGQYLHVKVAKDFKNVVNIMEYLAIILIYILGLSLLISPLQI